MQAVVCTDFNESVVTTVPDPEPAADEVLLEVDRVQLSVTECNLYRGERINHHEKIAAKLAEGDAQLWGHEFCARVIETGPAVESLAVGDRVYAPAKIVCHECRYCTSGYETFCPNKINVGYDIPGALAEYVALPAEILRPVPSSVSDAETAALQPLASALLCVRDAGIEFGDTVAVVGTGVMGYQAAQLALADGASRVATIDIDPTKLEIAERHGLIAINGRSDDPVSRIRDLTDGVGADVVIEAVGGHQSHATDGTDPIAQAFDMVKTGGKVVQIGYIIGEMSLASRAIRSKSIDYIHPVTGVESLGPGRDTGHFAAELVEQGRVSIADFITHELDGLASFEEAVEITLNKEDYGALGPAQIRLD